MQNHWMGTEKRSSWPVAINAVFMLAFSCNLTGVLNAQGRRPMMPVPSEGTLMPKPREVQALLDEVQANIAAKEWSEATLGLGILLGLETANPSDPDGTDYFMIDEEETDNVEAPTRSVSQTVLEWIEELPGEGRKRLELRYGAEATKLLEKSIADSDWESLARVAGRYSFIEAGQNACLIMGQHCLRQGDPRLAGRFLSLVSKQKSANERLGPQLGILTAAAYQAVALEAKAFQSVESTRNQFTKAAFDWRGTKVNWDGRSKLSKKIIEELAITGHEPIERVVREPHYVGGDSRRNSETNAGSPLPILKWHTELHESKQHKANLEKVIAERLKEGKSSVGDNRSTLIPTRYSINVGPWVIASTYDQRIVAVDATTGVLGWVSFYSGMPLGFSMDRFSSRDSHGLNYSAPDYLVKRVWGETVLGMLSSDGERVYSISELPALDVADSLALGPGARVAKMQNVRNYNVMQCWSVREEGKIKWEVGGAKSPSETELAGCLFLGSPLPHQGALFVMGELNSDVYLFVLQPETGKLLSKQPIATNTGAIAGDQLKRNVGATPAADGSLIICPTLSGFLVAYDAISNSLQWAFHYPTRNSGETSNQVGQFGQIEFGSYSPLAGRSADVSVVIHDGVVLFAPPDGEGVFALSEETGKLLWHTASMKTESEPRVENVRYIAGASNGIALIACQTSFAGLDIRTGKAKWPAIEYPRDDQLAGRGARKGNSYFLPTTGQEILQIDVIKGAIIEAVRVEQPLGNLTSIADRIVSASAYQLDCYAVREAFQSQLVAELKNNNTSAVGLAHQGELALAQGDYDAALTFLEQAKAQDPKNAEIKLLLNKAGIAALTANFDKYVDRVSLDKELAFDRERSPYLRLLIHGLQKQGRYYDALLKLFELSELRTSQRQDQLSLSGAIYQSKSLSIQEDRWIATQVRRSLGKLNAEERARMKTKMMETMTEIRRLPPNVRRLRLEHLIAFPETLQLRIDSAKDLIKLEDLLQAEGLLMSEREAEGAFMTPAQILQRKELLASIYFRTRRYDLALEYLDGDLNKYYDLYTQSITHTRGPLTQIQETLQSKGKAKSADEWPRTKVKVGEVQSRLNTNLLMYEMAMTCNWKTRIGTALRDWSVSAGQTTWTFSNARTSQEFQLYLETGNQERATHPTVYSVDSMAFIEMNRQIIAINTLLASTSEQDGLMWRKAFDPPPLEPGRGLGKLGLERNVWGLPVSKSTVKVAGACRDGLIISHDDVIECLELNTGTTAWTATGFTNCQFGCVDNVLLVYNPAQQMLIHLDTRDGDLLKETKLDNGDWNVIASLGKFWLMGISANKKSRLRLFDAVEGKAILEKDFSEAPRIALDQNVGVYALTDAGQLTYWNIPEGKEYTNEVDVDGHLVSLSAQRFGDTVLLLPNAPSMSLDSFRIGPEPTDPAFAPVLGRVVAVSAKDGSSVWKQSDLVREMYFPLSQDRTSPLAVFVRRIELTKIANKNEDLMSMALVDVRDGRVVFAKDDFPAIRTLGFHQVVLPEENRIEMDYQGTKVEITWDTEEDSGAKVYEFGNIKNEKEFKKEIEKRIRERNSAAQSTNPTDVIPEK